MAVTDNPPDFWMQRNPGFLDWPTNPWGFGPHKKPSAQRSEGGRKR